MRFVEFTPRMRTDLGNYITSASIMINLDHVMEVAADFKGGTVIHMVNGTTRRVEDDYEQVQTILKEMSEVNDRTD